MIQSIIEVFLIGFVSWLMVIILILGFLGVGNDD
jgi:hypothetical protein